MLTIHQPDSYHDKQRRRKRRALGYLTASLIILPLLFISMNTNWWYAAAILEAWWLWACWTDPVLK